MMVCVEAWRRGMTVWIENVIWAGCDYVDVFGVGGVSI